jgi:hypothetical protein
MARPGGTLRPIQYPLLTMSTQLIEREHDPDSRQPDQLVCPECELDVVWGAVYFELVCDGCGLVVDEKEIDYGPEWRAYDDRERYRKSRVGAPLSSAIHHRGLTRWLISELLRVNPLLNRCAYRTNVRVSFRLDVRASKALGRLRSQDSLRSSLRCGACVVRVPEAGLALSVHQDDGRPTGGPGGLKGRAAVGGAPTPQAPQAGGQGAQRGSRRPERREGFRSAAVHCRVIQDESAGPYTNCTEQFV